MARLIAVCRSDKEGTRKESISAIESINKMRKMEMGLNSGDFAENLTTEGIDLVSLPAGTRLTVGNVAQ